MGEFVYVDISESDDRWPELEANLGNLDVSHTVGTRFSKKEIRESDWLLAGVGEFQYPQPENGYREITYDLSNACKLCATGKNQKAPFRLRGDFTQKRAVFLGLHWVFDVIFIRPHVVRMLQREFGDSIRTLPVLCHRTGKEVENLLQLKIPVLEREFITDTDMIFEVCNLCGVAKRIRKERGMIATSPLEEGEGSPLFLTSEWFGAGRSSRRQIVASNAFMRFVENQKLRGLRFEPLNTGSANQ
ncbi:MAG: hypothetical protein H6752_21330 [Candidatus Omnitrophica bacterium]|nr:hypothetical protein [Candidatus Omnitrophota bacterium]